MQYLRLNVGNVITQCSLRLHTDTIYWYHFVFVVQNVLVSAQPFIYSEKMFCPHSDRKTKGMHVVIVCMCLQDDVAAGGVGVHRTEDYCAGGAAQYFGNSDGFGFTTQTVNHHSNTRTEREKVSLWKEKRQRRKWFRDCGKKTCDITRTGLGDF